MQVAEVDQGMSHGGEIALRPLDLENLPIALFCARKIVHERAGVAKVPKRIRQRLLIAGSPIVGHSRFPGSVRLNQVAAMEKNPSPMFMVVGHTNRISFNEERFTLHEIRVQSPPLGVSRLYSVCNSSCSSNPRPARKEPYNSVMYSMSRGFLPS